MVAGEKVLQPTEAANLTTVRRSIVAGRDLKAGEVIALEDLTWMRPGSGFRPGDEHLIVGKMITRRLEKGDPISPSDIK